MRPTQQSPLLSLLRYLCLLTGARPLLAFNLPLPKKHHLRFQWRKNSEKKKVIAPKYALVERHYVAFMKLLLHILIAWTLA
ncbi:hypothetical protein CEXT_10791 [Caerostris extrusa]|uniref:Secreted protein n=1 Tax=Caerostris extrusa TaxID=172846 RepID=A0AAV4NUQ9_CAEEX|nr:hypothetical protein CEXT_10791 [Caerostris extrusa]